MSPPSNLKYLLVCPPLRATLLTVNVNEIGRDGTRCLVSFVQLSLQLQITTVLGNLRVQLFHKFDFLRYISALIFICIHRFCITLWK